MSLAAFSGWGNILFSFLRLYLFICMYVYMHTIARVEITGQLAGVFYSIVGLRDWTQGYRVWPQVSYQLSHLAKLRLSESFCQTQIIYSYLSQFWSSCISENLYLLLKLFNSVYFYKANSNVHAFISDFILTWVFSLTSLGRKLLPFQILFKKLNSVFFLNFLYFSSFLFILFFINTYACFG